MKCHFGILFLFASVIAEGVDGTSKFRDRKVGGRIRVKRGLIEAPDPNPNLTGIKGVATGVVHGAQEFEFGVIRSLRHPITTLDQLADVVSHPVKSFKTLQGNLKDECKTQGTAECIGKTSFDIATMGSGSLAGVLGPSLTAIAQTGQVAGAVGLVSSIGTGLQ